MVSNSDVPSLDLRSDFLVLLSDRTDCCTEKPFSANC